MRFHLAAGKYRSCEIIMGINFLFRQSNPDIQAWMKNQGYTDYAKLEEYYENK